MRWCIRPTAAPIHSNRKRNMHFLLRNMKIIKIRNLIFAIFVDNALDLIKAFAL